MPIAVLLTSWVLGVSEPSLKTLGNVSLIVVGVVIASFGEIQFVLVGFLFQVGGIIFEAIRLVMVERLLSGSGFKMDPLVSLYYFAPACAVMNGITALLLEVPKISIADIERVGYFTLLANAMIAFLLNVSVVILVRLHLHHNLHRLTSLPQIGKTSSLVMTLSGVLKDILLVLCSMTIFRDPVSPLQAFGYSIALLGLIYYKFGADKMKEYVGQGQRSWADFTMRHPALRRVLMWGLVITILFILLGGISFSGVLPSQYDPSTTMRGKIDEVIGKTGS